MRKISKKILVLFLSLALILTLAAGSVAYGGAYDPRRISVSAKYDGLTKGFCWYTDADTDTKVRVYLNELDVTDSLAVSEVHSKQWEGSFMHKLTLSGLEAGKTYTYKVGDGNIWSLPGKFVTDDGDDSFDFITISDVQASSLENFQKGADTLAAALKVMPDAEFLANCGDFTNDSTNEEWDFYDEAFNELNRNLTIVPVSGNHDGFGVHHWFANMFNLDTSESVQNLNGVNYSFDYGNAHIAVLNTNDLMAMSDAQLKWFKNDMNSTDKDWKIAFMHKSPYTLGKDGKWPDALYLQDSFAALCDEVNVDLVMSGHDHQYLRTKQIVNNKPAQGGTVYVLAGTAGSKRYEIRPFLAEVFTRTKLIDALVIQKSGHGNYWNGKDWNSKKDTNIGGCFSTISIRGGKLELNAYILADAKDSEGQDVITKIDSLTLEKETGKNKITYTGDNTTSLFDYILQVLPSAANLAKYAFGSWMPKFLFILPYIIYVYATDGVF